VTECDVPAAPFAVCPSAVVVPKDTTLLDDSSVLQATVRLDPDPVTVTPEITGAAVSATVKVAGGAGGAGDVVELPAASTDDTR
jgi:hypothetical protein